MSDSHAPAPSLEKRISLENDALQRWVLLIGQDIVYCASNGKIKMHKHLALPVAVKHITGSSQLVTLLNQLGHSVSDSQVNALNTTVAEDQLRQHNLSAAFIPSNIARQATPITLCRDNNDILEEIPTGLGTSHVTNGIVGQHRFLPAPPEDMMATEPAICRSSRKRSIQVPEKFNPVFNSGRREGPPLLCLPIGALHPSPDSVFNHEEFAWIVARLQDQDSDVLGQQKMGTSYTWLGWLPRLVTLSTDQVRWDIYLLFRPHLQNCQPSSRSCCDLWQ